jgi:hypothetical protein
MTDSLSPSTNSQVAFCSQCGHKNSSGFKFCQNCGQASVAPHITTSVPDSAADAQGAEEAPMTLSKATVQFLGFWLLLLVTSGLYWPLGVLTYFVAGYWMTRNVMGQLIAWHPNYNTLDNVVSGKLRMFFLWPLNMPFLLIKLAFDKAL